MNGRGETTQTLCGKIAGGALVAAVLAAAIGPRAAVARASRSSLDQWEIRFPNEDFSRLDTFEAHALTKADKAYNEENYKQAHALYEAFTLEFGKSKAVPYALLRMGRCLHRLGKRHKAVEEYQEVLDYFPNRVRYAAAALYYQGLCHWENAEEKKAMLKWMAMAKDADYSKHFLAAPAFNQLAAHFAKQNQLDSAADYYEKVAVNFRLANRAAAFHAMRQVIRHHVRVNPNEARLRGFYQNVGAFDYYRPRKVEGDVSNDRKYWEQVRAFVKRYDDFKDTEAGLREQYFRYWADRMRGRFPDWDDFQIDLANFSRVHEKDAAKWFRRLDGQFRKYQKKADYDRVLKWIATYCKHKNKVKEYYARLDFARMSNAQIFSLVKLMFDKVEDADLGRNVFAKLRLAKMADKEKVELARYFWRKDEEELVKRACGSITDRDLGRMELLRYYHAKKDAKNGVPIARRMESVAKYAGDALWLKAELLRLSKQYEKAISAYQACNNPPDNIWRIADCYAELGKLKPAVGELRQVESFFRARYGAQASLRIAHLYHRFKLTKQYVAELRAVLKKYPGSKESSQAHVELENMGYTPGGGEDAKD